MNPKKPRPKPIASGWIALAAGLTLLIVSIALAAWNTAHANDAPDFDLPALDGGQLQLSSFRGKVVLLNFWATWCVPCREEMPDLEAAQTRYGDQGLAVIGVNIAETAALARAFVDEVGVTFPIVLDEDVSMAASFRVSGLPVSILIDRHGIIVYRHYGQFHPKQIGEQIQPLLDKP